MTLIHVCLVSEQPIPNLLPLLLEKPNRAVFLVSPEMTAQAERLKKIAQPRGIRVEIREVSSAYDFEEVVRVCSLIERQAGKDEELVLNTTGGTKVAALAAFQVFFSGNRRIIYLDTLNNRLLELAPAGKPLPVPENLIKVQDCLISYGMNPLTPERAAGERKRPGLDQFAELLIRDNALLSRLNYRLEQQKNKPYANLLLEELAPGAENLAELLVKCGVARLTDTGGLNIPSADRVFFCKGGWLEEYAYWKVRELGLKGLDAALNVKVEWDGRSRPPTENEFDVLFTHCNRLHIISCKSSNPGRESATGTRATEALNELDALAERAGGLFGRAVLVSARRLRDADRERAKKMKIRLVEGQDVLRLREHLRSWLHPQ